ncbi:hypothetical protein DSO57_1037936 [Entomophthora muscae]|uniref:Uncharacterized protein n=1 Tax=Entomophthora muscae TaxID=34485 RepID=A0ACC2U8J0_9FUNG|nr:hypothetical protein DSO57_1037936 [Entomophthora muscae]
MNSAHKNNISRTSTGNTLIFPTGKLGIRRRTFNGTIVIYTKNIGNCVKFSTNVKFCGPPLALDWDVFPRPSKKVARVQTKPLQNLEDLAHTVDKRFVLAFPAEVPISPLESPPTAEETLIQLDCLLSWCLPVLKQLANQQKKCGPHEVRKIKPAAWGNWVPKPAISGVPGS